MEISRGSFPLRATKIDEINRKDHYYIVEEDQCFFIGEYTSRKGFQHSQTNQLVLNLKKGMDRRGRPEWRYKQEAIEKAGRTLGAVLSQNALDNFTFVPVPPSKAKSDSLYDDRMVQVVRHIRAGRPVDGRELILQHTSTEPAHDRDQRPTPEDIAALYEINEQFVSQPRHPVALIIVDDVLTTGAHFKATQAVLKKQFPEVPIFGLFVARRAIDDVHFEELQ